MDKKVLDFLTRILSDKGYRAQVEKDPEKILRSLNVPFKPGDVKTPASLPSDEEIKALLALAKHWDKLEQYNYSWFFICGWPKP
jgi:hypothetical protein